MTVIEFSSAARAGAHVRGGHLSNEAGVAARGHTEPDKSRRWRESMQSEPLADRADGNRRAGLWEAKPFRRDGRAGTGARLRLIILKSPPSASQISPAQPVIEEGCVIVGLPGPERFRVEREAWMSDSTMRRMNVECGSGLPDRWNSAKPWDIRTKEVCRPRKVTRTARVKTAGVHPATLGRDPRLVAEGTFGITLRAPNAYSHLRHVRRGKIGTEALRGRRILSGNRLGHGELLAR